MTNSVVKVDVISTGNGANSIPVGEMISKVAKIPFAGDLATTQDVNEVASQLATDCATRQAVAQVVTESTTARTLGLADAGVYLRCTNAAATAVTVSPQASVAWAAHAEIHIRRAGAGNLTLTPGSGVTLIAPAGGSLVLADRMSVTLKRAAENVWDVLGQTVPA